jgi:thymidylate synthase (FAD)
MIVTKIMKPKFQILSHFNERSILRHLELCGRTCYKSEDKITNDSCYKFIKMLLSRGHESVIEHYNISIKFICSRSLSHQLVRHRLCSFSEQSQRYCNFETKIDMGIIQPYWLDPLDAKKIRNKSFTSVLQIPEGISNKCRYWLESIIDSVNSYGILLRSNPEMTPQQVRSLLPNAAKTEIVCTANLRQWRHILKLRTSKGADPEIKELMIPLLKKLQEKLPTLFSDIEVEQ